MAAATDEDDLFSSFLDEIKSVSTGEEGGKQSRELDGEVQPSASKKAKVTLVTVARPVVAVAAVAAAQPSTDFRDVRLGPRTTPAYGGGGGGGGGAGIPGMDGEAQPAPSAYHQQQSTYKYDPNGNGTRAAAAAQMRSSEGGKQASEKKFVRIAAGKKWVDPTLSEWPENDFRLFVGDIGNEINDDQLTKHFQDKYPSFAKAKIVRDKASGKPKGFGFVSFLDGFDMLKALRQEDGKYLGSRPMKIRRSDWRDRDIKEVKKKEKKQRKQKAALGLL
jgi:hypothetical protein